MKLLFDTNVLIAALISQGFCHELLEHCFIEHDLYTSEFILSELKEKLIEKFKFSTELADEAVDLFAGRMKIVQSDALQIAICKDPDDDNIIAAALTASCDCIITGDKDLLVIRQYESTQILTPREFVDRES